MQPVSGGKCETDVVEAIIPIPRLFEPFDCLVCVTQEQVSIAQAPEVSGRVGIARTESHCLLELWDGLVNVAGKDEHLTELEQCAGMVGIENDGSLECGRGPVELRLNSVEYPACVLR